MNTKTTVIALVGKSGSGKTYASILMGRQPGFSTIVSYTTRPMREGEQNGRDHWFVSAAAKPSACELFAYTVYGGYEYWTTWQQFADTETKHVYVVDEKGLRTMRDNPRFNRRVRLHTVAVKREGNYAIDAARAARDQSRETLNDEEYDTILYNDGTLEDYDRKIIRLCRKIDGGQ